MDKKELENINMTLEEARKTLIRDLVNTFIEKENVPLMYYLITSLCSQENCDSLEACVDSKNMLNDIRDAIKNTDKLTEDEKKQLCKKIDDCMVICEKLIEEFPHAE